MKISKKTIAIILVVAVAAWLLYKKSRMTVAGLAVSDTPAGSTGGVDVNNLESVIAASGMTSSDASEVRRYARTVEASTVKRENVQAKANEWGVTLTQMTALLALWNKYCTMENGQSVFKPEYRSNGQIKNYYWKLVQTIRDLY